MLCLNMNRSVRRHLAAIKWIRYCSSITSTKQIAKSVFKFREYTPENGFVWNSPYEKTAIPNMTIDQYVWQNMAKWENKVAIQCSVTGRKYTYAKLRDHCAAFAVRLRTWFGLKDGDIVGICLPNIPGNFLLVD